MSRLFLDHGTRVEVSCDRSVNATGRPMHFMFGSSGVWFSESADRMALFPVGDSIEIIDSLKATDGGYARVHELGSIDFVL